MATTLYEILGVSRSSSKTAEIEKAYEILIDEQKRAEYDETIASVEGFERTAKRSGAFFGWGVALLIVGVLSFVIPLSGRQFVVVRPFVAMGLHPAAVGLLFVIAGGALIAMAKSQ